MTDNRHMVPTKDVPHGLTPEEYFKLGVQYMLMGWKRQAASSMKMAIEGHRDLSRTPLSGIPEEQRRALEAVLGFAEITLDFGDQAKEAARDVFGIFESVAAEADKVIETTDGLKELKQELLDVFGYFSRQAQTVLDSFMNEIVMPTLGLPTRDLPEGMLAEEYLRLGQQYKDMGWTEQARDSFERVIEIDPDSEAGDLARKYMRTKIPRQPVPHYAVRKNIAGHRMMAAGLNEFARRTFEELIQDYPSFEWPYGNLGLLLIRLGDLDRAEHVLNQALDINPTYLNAWLHLSRAQAVRLNLREAKSCLDQALRLDPEDNNAKTFQILLDYLASL